MKSIFIAIQLGLCLVQAADLFDSSNCGAEKVCERRPANCQNASDCNLFFGSRPLNENQIEIELWAPSKLGNGQNLNYLAVGFSKDTQMGDDSVTYCYKLNSGETGIGSGKTVGKQFVPGQDSTLAELKGIQEEDNQFYCKFVQNVNSGSNDLLKPDLAKEYHILVVRGTTSDGKTLDIHSFGPIDGPFASSQPHLLATKPDSNNFAATSNSDSTVSSETTEPSTAVPLLIRFHGALMLIAWLAFVFIAIFSARYLREHWPNTTVAGLQIWFHIHRMLNVIGLILIIVSVILIFVYTDFNWTGPSAGSSSSINTSSIAIHSLLGTISVLLAIFQPFMAMMRCDKNHSKRPIFNIFHRSAGLLALILAVITLGIALLSGGFRERIGWVVPVAVPVIFIAFLVFVAIILSLQEVIRIREDKEHQKITAIEMQTRNPAPSDSYYYKGRTIHSTRYRHITSILFVVFVSVSISVAVLLSYFVFTGVKRQ